MKQPKTYAEYLETIEKFTPYEAVERVEQAVGIAESLPHWFDRQRAITALAKRVSVDENLLFRMMTRGKQ